MRMQFMCGMAAHHLVCRPRERSISAWIASSLTEISAPACGLKQKSQLLGIEATARSESGHWGGERRTRRVLRRPPR